MRLRVERTADNVRLGTDLVVLHELFDVHQRRKDSAARSLS